MSLKIHNVQCNILEYELIMIERVYNLELSKDTEGKNFKNII